MLVERMGKKMLVMWECLVRNYYWCVFSDVLETSIVLGTLLEMLTLLENCVNGTGGHGLIAREEVVYPSFRQIQGYSQR